MLFFSYFKEIVGRVLVVELKNDLAIRGTLRSVDQNLNIKLENTRVVDQDKYPHMDGKVGVHGDVSACTTSLSVNSFTKKVQLKEYTSDHLCSTFLNPSV
uniref:Sm domain-containing protein n=1 Tax=Chenopodium quinoa TaxID=63459 RepID=A0A803N744_CHEQI